MTTKIDPLTIAYMAIGAARALDAADGPGNALAGGELEFIADVICHAPTLERLYLEHAGNYVGAFVYDVAEPFGHAYAAAVIAGNAINVEWTVRNLIAADLV